MNIVWFSWKDINHPEAGGAESVSWRLMQSLVKDGHKVRHITARYTGSEAKSINEGVEVWRTGSRFSVYPKARKLFKKQMVDWPDLVIDEMNTIPFGAGFYTRKKSVLLTYQLARKVWFYQMPFPISVVGFAIEPIYLFMLSRKYKVALTESESTRQELSHFGFSKENIKTFRVGIDLKPIVTLEKKDNMNSVLILGAMRPMKRTLSAIRGFENARDSNPELHLTIAGDTTGVYAEKTLKYIEKSRHKSAINVLGRVTAEQRLQVMRKATLILVTSIKEGWGLIVTEANSQGTPAIAYNSDGLRDSIRDQSTGLLIKSGDELALGKAINELVGNKDNYERLRQQAWQNSKQYTFENSYKDFLKAID